MPIVITQMCFQQIIRLCGYKMLPQVVLYFFQDEEALLYNGNSAPMWSNNNTINILYKVAKVVTALVCIFFNFAFLCFLLIHTKVYFIMNTDYYIQN